ncbi:esterase/lipase family protein [Lacipirellula sp.]|uniref:esterase/lipase family protein n=1 Tax=Lacipirellula sp. TaxID=2691419 RepID=UPI003D14261D
MPEPTAATRDPQPLILIRGFGGLDVEDERRVAYQGFNDGTVYPLKRGENYIYEGMLLRFLKCDYKYFDATNVIGYYRSPSIAEPKDLPPQLEKLGADLFVGGKMVVDPGMAMSLVKQKVDIARTVWVFRYYDLDDRKIKAYGKALVRLIDFIRKLASIDNGTVPKVNIIAHSMGGLLVREAIQASYPESERKASDFINKVVTLGTPHRGITFQLLKKWLFIESADELKHFSPEFQRDSEEPSSYVNFQKFFPKERFLTVVGTNYRTYGVRVASTLNRLFGVDGEYGPNYNRSDGLVKQTNAELPGCPRTFVHKCHGGEDSLVTSREAYEIATRFFFGNIKAKLSLVKAEVNRKLDIFGKSEIFFGVSIKPRGVDFDLFHQSREAENCYGPFADKTLGGEATFNWAGPGKLIWEGYLDTSKVKKLDDEDKPNDMVLRLDFYVGERDLLGIGFSDNVIFSKQYYVRAIMSPKLKLYLHTNEEFAEDGFAPTKEQLMHGGGEKWEFDVAGTGFNATLRIELQRLDKQSDDAS